MLLKRLEIRNVRKIKQADIDFHGPGLQIIQGMNESGKTTIAQCIALSLEGPKSFVPGMIAQGEERAEVMAYLEGEQELKIRTVISGSVKQTVSEKDQTSGKYAALSGGVRSFIDSIRSGLEMPWAMRDMTDARIIEILKDRAGITQTIAEIDAAIKDKESARTETGRDKKRLGTKDPVEKAKHLDPIESIQSDRAAAAEYLNKLRETLVKASDHIRAKCVFNSLQDIEALHEVIAKSIEIVKCHLKDDKVYTQADIDEMDKMIADWVEEERKATAYDEYKTWKKETDKLDEFYKTLTAEIEDLRDKRKKTLAGIKLGVKGLVIGEDNLLYHHGAVRGITETNRIGNWSTAESVKVFFTIGASFSGDLRVLVVDNAESLDDVTTGVISKWAENSGFLVILLKIANVPEELEDGIIYVKEGEIISNSGASHGEQ
jgi:DNA repair exonuclease SbcCD ATPase subunit